jgi:hypothetical protein
MTGYEKNSDKYEWDCNAHDDTNAHPNRLVHPVIHSKNKGCENKPDYSEYNTSDQFPFPSH